MRANHRFIVTKTILSASLVAMPAAAQPVSDPCQPVASCPNEVEADTPTPPYLMATSPSPDGTYDGPPSVANRPSENTDRSPDDQTGDRIDDGDAPAETSHGEDEVDADEDGGSDLPELLAVATGVVVVAAVTSALLGSNWASAADLYRDGPRFSRRQRLGRFRVQGFVRSGWPFVVDLETEPGVTTWLEVSVKGMDRRHFLPLDGDGRRLAYVQIPRLGRGDDLRVARLTLHSAVLRPGARAEYRPLRVHSMAAGPYAVESASLAMTSLQPGAGAYGSPTFWIGSIGPRQARSAGDIQFSLMARRPYEQARVEVLRLPRSPEGRLSRVGGVTLTPLLQGPSRHGWRQIGVNPRPARGVYLVQAKAWRTTRNQGDWTGARAPGLVTIQ